MLSVQTVCGRISLLVRVVVVVILFDWNPQRDHHVTLIDCCGTIFVDTQILVRIDLFSLSILDNVISDGLFG